MYKIFIVVLIMCSACLYAETENSLVMVRCDNGSEDGFLPSPQDMELSTLKANLNPNVDTVVLVHGFNTSYSSAKSSYTTACSALVSELGNRNYVGFYWPSNTWLSFGTAVKHANAAGKYLIYMLSEISKICRTTRVHIICHSLGGRVLLSTLQQNEARYVRWGKNCLLAAAVHNNIFFTSFANTNLVSQYNYVYFSKNDGVLKYLYSLYYWLFDRKNQKLPGAEKFLRLSTTEQLRYMDALDNGKFTARSEFDRELLRQIRIAEKDAMGLVGAFRGNSNELRKVENIEVSNIVDGHSYWGNSTVIRMAAKKIAR
ncbi:alpha/beta hydrolase [Candidatus Uabimicrobium amorphum]|uniref:DUF676 domain-containing protein n=1 Tax=Uabimicrobium amorphum TaxID=2596890 RepID=A0A5S9F2C6_UABAM|nr:alpha/beta hydrolase [Candidatus Uabimicrobium amorphum]BBM83525.1 hypothetical protein UABAM_01877 [Candidatus Uabimicrobium amorphum]